MDERNIDCSEQLKKSSFLKTNDKKETGKKQ